MTIYNDSVSKYYQCTIQDFCRGISMFLVSVLPKKIAKAIKFLGLVKKCPQE